MTPLRPNYIAYSGSPGLEKDKKPFLLPDEAFPVLENAYVWRERVKKRNGNKLLGRLARALTVEPLDLSTVGVWSFNLFTKFQTSTTGSITAVTPGSPTIITSNNHGLFDGSVVKITGVGGITGLNGGTYSATWINANQFSVPVLTGGIYTVGGTWVTPANSIASVSTVAERPEIECGSVVLTMRSVAGAVVDRTFTDDGEGRLIADSLPGTNFGTINYSTGDIVLTTTFASQRPTNIALRYHPSLPVMGIWQIDIANINDEETVFFDTKYAYKFVSGVSQEYIPFTTWNGSDSDFFWAANYRGTEASDRIMFVTNFINDDANPIRYTDRTTWTDFSPAISSTEFLWQAKILIPYYGRLLALCTWEGTTRGTSSLFFNRCRFSQIGNPLQADAWREDIFGKGGFIDAPINQEIVGAQFFKNTLIVFFERSTWQLRYVGEYGLPFIWERVSSDFGSESTYSGVLFDEGVLAVGDRAIISSTGINATRIDLKIPDIVFDFRNALGGTKRVHSARDFQQELVYWCYSDVNSQEPGQYFPNNVLVFNYRNNTYATFRDNITTFGVFNLQDVEAVTWGRLDVFWNDMNQLWRDVGVQTEYPIVVSGNQQGYIHFYHEQNQVQNDLNLTISAVTATSVLTLTIYNHNLSTGDFIYITGMHFLSSGGSPASTSLNDTIYQVLYVDTDNVTISKWNAETGFYETGFTYTPSLLTNTYIGCGQASLFPVMLMQTKDFNPYIAQGNQLKVSYIDFLTDATPNSSVTVNVFANTSLSVQTNLDVGNKIVETSLTSPYYVPASDYAWHRLYQTSAGSQFITLQVTYGDDLMNDITTHQSTYVQNAMCIWTRQGGKTIF